MKQPKYSVQPGNGFLIVKRIQEPRFSAHYFAETPGELQNVVFEGEEPANKDRLLKMGIEAAKHSRLKPVS